MSFLRWSVLSGLAVSVAFACGSSDSDKAPPHESAGGEGGAGVAGEPNSGQPHAGQPTVMMPPSAGGQGGSAEIATAGQGGTPQASEGSMPNAGQAGNAIGGGGGEVGGAGGAAETGCVPVQQLGGHIYYSTVLTADAPSGEVRVATKAGDTKLTDGSNPKLAPDGKHLALQRGRRSATDLSTADVWMRDMVANTEMNIFTNTDHQVAYAFTADSTRLLYDWGCGQYSMNLDGTGGATLFETDCYDDDPSPQPIANGLFAYHNESGIQLRDSTFANPHTMTNSLPGDYWPAWSQDGQWLTFCAYTSATLTCAFQKMAPNGDSRTHLGDTTQANDAAFSVDGTKIVASGLKDGAPGLHVFAADGSGYLGTVCGASTEAVDFVGTITAD